MEQDAQDGQNTSDMGIAYNMQVRARRYYKKGVKQDEMRMIMELVVIREDEEIVGRVSLDVLGGGFIISDDRHEEQWLVDCKEIWKSYEEMRAEMLEEDK